MASKMKRRSRARELALQALYQVDLTRDADRSSIDAFLDDQEAEEEPREFARTLVYGTLEHQEEIDATISLVAQNWAISRMAVIDRNVLRLAAHELLHRDDIPPKVSINEAIEIGKRFSTTNSGAFINGILDKIMNQHTSAADAAGDEAQPSSTEDEALPSSTGDEAQPSSTEDEAQPSSTEDEAQPSSTEDEAQPSSTEDEELEEESA